MQADKPKTASCYDHYLMTTVEGLMLHTVNAKGSRTILWTPAAGVTQNELWDIQTKGVRFFYFLQPKEQTIMDLLATGIPTLCPYRPTHPFLSCCCSQPVRQRGHCRCARGGRQGQPRYDRLRQIAPHLADPFLDFMAKYAQRNMVPRKTQEVPVDESLIQSGRLGGALH